MDTKNQPPESGVMHSFSGEKKAKASKAIVVFVIAMVLGAGTGYLVSNSGSGLGSSKSEISATGDSKGQKVFGSDDAETFSDEAEGVLRKGGIEGEGQYHLERPGGESQNVYMTSSLVDLSLFIGKRIKVWGQTQQAQTAGWLMDVGRVEVL